MSVIFLLLTVSTLVATVFLVGFIWAVRKGQYDDDRSPAVRILLDDGVQAEKPMRNGEWRMANGKDQEADGEQRMANGNEVSVDGEKEMVDGMSLSRSPFTIPHPSFPARHSPTSIRQLPFALRHLPSADHHHSAQPVAP